MRLRYGFRDVGGAAKDETGWRLGRSDNNEVTAGMKSRDNGCGVFLLSAQSGENLIWFEGLIA